ncbi:MAG: AMIN domain-containing protein [Desulfomonilaceae bacterium]|nr:AMIN domain-containing protein [Desulfomonilaceae bacterium]
MIAFTRKCLFAFPAAVLFMMLHGAFTAWATGDNLTNVTASPDLRRIIIESSSVIGQYNVFELERPPRLVIDIQGMKPGKAMQTTPPERTGGLKIAVSESRSGSHVVLDFGGGPVPSHRIRRMDNYLIVFLGEWIAPSATTPTTAPVTAIPQPDPKTEISRPQRRAGNQGNPSSELSDLTIKSAQVRNGIIVLKVADRADPERLFSINLGVNLNRLGFVSAGIHPLTTGSGPVLETEKRSRDSSPAPEERVPRGPRKTSEPDVSEPDVYAPSANSADSTLGGTRPGAAERRSFSGPIRAPIRSGPSGPVRQIHGASVNGWKTVAIPRQSVAETARAVLAASRRAPHTRFETCGFGKNAERDGFTSTVPR